MHNFIDIVLVSLNCQVYIISCLFTFHCKCIMLSLPCIRLVFTLCLLMLIQPVVVHAWCMYTCLDKLPRLTI